MSIRGGIAFITAVWSALAIALAMFGFGVYQWLAGHAPTDLLLEHGAHVLVLGALIHLVLNVVLRRLVARPITRVGSHLYGVATGHTDYLDLQSPVREIGQMVQAVNIMIDRIKMRRDISGDLAFVRSRMHELEVDDDLRRDLEQRFERLQMILGV